MGHYIGGMCCAFLAWMVTFLSFVGTSLDRDLDGYVVEKYTVKEDSFLRKFFFWKRAKNFSTWGWLDNNYFLSFYAIPAFITSIASPIIIIVGIISIFYSFIPYNVYWIVAKAYASLFIIYDAVIIIKTVFHIWPSDEEYLDLDLKNDKEDRDDKFR